MNSSAYKESILELYGKSEEELKLSILKSLFVFSVECPDLDEKLRVNFMDMLESFHPNFWETELFINRFRTSVAQFDNVDFEDQRLGAQDKLILLALNMEFLIALYKLKFTLKQTWRRQYSLQLLNLKHQLLLLLEDKKSDVIKENNFKLSLGDISDIIDLGYTTDLFLKSIEAEKGIERILGNKENLEIFNHEYLTYLKKIEDYFDSKLKIRFDQMLDTLWLETLNATIPTLLRDLNLPQTFIKKFSVALKSASVQYTGSIIDDTYGKLSGGEREYGRFTWKPENKIRFYEMVESLPKVARKKKGTHEQISIWQHIFEQFNLRGDEAWNSLKGEPGFKLVPKDLVKEAFHKWEIYEQKSKNIEMEFSWQMYRFKHALRRLNYPEERFVKRENTYLPYKYSTLKKHYDFGSPNKSS